MAVRNHKKQIVKSLAKQLGVKKADLEYYIAYILDYFILEALRMGEVRFDSHVFKKSIRKGKKFTSNITGKSYKIEEVEYVKYMYKIPGSKGRRIGCEF